MNRWNLPGDMPIISSSPTRCHFHGIWWTFPRILNNGPWTVSLVHSDRLNLAELSAIWRGNGLIGKRSLNRVVNGVSMNWKQQVILITGGTGSFGKKFIDIML